MNEYLKIALVAAGTVFVMVYLGQVQPGAKALIK